ncbi:ImpA family type VI secretion system protein [Paraburkholderia sp. J94]|uniref:type VI secretion system protein TssA n=1 Tax=Paraburkholderia sp. J94 TaxID=2805441 RepID=UPI002AB203EE|nr:type VI secretion system ImpA family N-terminal domain-containing protein [Paraburkholderia sp. J94]
MSQKRKQNPQAEKNPQAPQGRGANHDWMAPISAGEPCGVDLEYDPEFVVLSASVAAKADAQYGDFVGTPEPVNWSDVDRDCRRLMVRSKDLRLALLFIRCRTRLAAAAGFAEGLGLLAGWLMTFPDLVHPQLGVDEDRSAALEIRMNALQSLTDADGLISDLREIALTRSTQTRLQLRDVERAFAHPRPSDALTPDSVTRQLEELRMQRPSVLSGFDDAMESLTAIEGWCREHLGVYTPDLTAIKRLLRHVAIAPGSRQVEAAAEEEGDVQADAEESTALIELPAASGESDADALPEPMTPRTTARASDRHAALNLIREARYWFEQHEPSSPIPVLLRRAEQFVGKRYADVVHAIPAELLAQWESVRDDE